MHGQHNYQLQVAVMGREEPAGEGTEGPTACKARPAPQEDHDKPKREQLQPVPGGRPGIGLEELKPLPPLSTHACTRPRADTITCLW
jgi:hypothetical protein